MLTQAIPAVQQLRRVQGFDPLRFLKRNASGGIELEPRYQRLWFRLACPDGKMLLNRLQITDQIAVYEAQVFLSREDNQPITNFTAAVEKAQAPAGRYVQAAQDEALKTALDNAGFGIQLCEITPSATVDAQADGKQEVATGTVNRQETAPAVNGAAAPQREDPIGENHPVQAVPTPQEVQPQEAAKTPNVNQQEVHTTQQTESVSDAMSLLQALSGGTAASEPDPVTEAEQSDAASVQEVHQTLSMLLSMLTLIPAHRTHLQSVRGLSDDEITRFGFKSTPPSFLCRSLTNRLVKAGCRVQGVPGFYVDDNGCWTVKFHQRTSGIIIPIFGVDGLIRGAQIRLDHPLKDKDDPPEKTGVKYLTLSSTGKRMGTTSGSPIHFVGDPCSRVVYVTEGCLKADVAHALMHRTFVATLGVNNTAKLDELFAFLHRNGTEEIIEAEDMDKYSNEMVGKGASKIYALAAKHGMRCRRLTWNPNYKGIDDWQLALRRKEQKMKEDPGMTFKEQYLNGLCGLEMLEACTEKWHAMKVDSISLRDYLGLTEQEYDAYLQTDPGVSFQKLLDSQRKTQRFRVYQLELEHGETRAFAFGGIDALHKAGFQQPPAAEYTLVYDGMRMTATGISVLFRISRVRSM